MATIPNEKECLIRIVCREIVSDIAEMLSRMTIEELYNFRYLPFVDTWLETLYDNQVWFSVPSIYMKKVKKEFMEKVIDRVVNQYGR